MPLPQDLTDLYSVHLKGFPSKAWFQLNQQQKEHTWWYYRKNQRNYDHFNIYHVSKLSKRVSLPGDERQTAKFGILFSPTETCLRVP